MASPRSARLGLLSFLAATLVLAACAPAPMLQPPEVTQAPPEAPPEGADAALEEYYSQDVDWTECGRNQCATVQVPMDYDNPDGDSIDLALMMSEARVSSQGALVLNPGGPGGSGLELVENIDDMFTTQLLESFDVVGFDPRGVGESDAVRCLGSAELDEYFTQAFNLDTDAGWDDFVSAQTEYGEACLANTGELLGFVDTVSSARDLDIIRAVLGENALTYLGYSYGTFLGATYAELFPDRVERLVLDGAIDPSLSYTEVAHGQAEGFDLAYRSYIEDCQAGPDCPFSGDVDDAIAETVDLLTMLADDPMPSADPDRPVTDADLINTLIIALYNVQSWPVLTQALGMLIQDDDAHQIRVLSDIAMEREENATYPPDEGAFRAINCLDFPVELDRDQITADAADISEASEVFGDYLGYGEVGCATMPFDATGTRGPITAAHTPPILVIGTTRDPATPHEWSEAMAEQLESGVLVSYDGDGHTAYGGRSSCVNDVVDDFLLHGQVPADGTEC